MSERNDEVITLLFLNVGLLENRALLVHGEDMDSEAEGRRPGGVVRF